MKKNENFKSKLINFNCVACGKVHQLLSTIENSDYSVDVCSNCHPFYLGATGTGQVKGRAEKLMKKFNTGKSIAKNKKSNLENN